MRTSFPAKYFSAIILVLALVAGHTVSATAADVGKQDQESSASFELLFRQAESSVGRGHWARTDPVDFESVRAAYGRAAEAARNDTQRARAILKQAMFALLDTDWTDWNELRSLYRSVLELPDAGEDEKARAHIGIGDTWLRENDYTSAGTAFREAGGIFESPACGHEVDFALARYALQKGDMPEAKSILSSLLRQEELDEALRWEAKAHLEGLILTIRLRQDRPRLFVNAETWPAVVERALSVHLEEYERIKGLVERFEHADIQAGDYGMNAMNAAFVYRITDDAMLLAHVRAMLHAGSDFLLSRVVKRGSYQSRTALIAAMDWVWDDLVPSERRDLAASLLKYGTTLCNEDIARGTLHRRPFYYEKNFFWYLGLAAYDDELDDLSRYRALVLLGVGQLHNWALWSAYPDRRGDDGGTGAFAVGRIPYEYGSTPMPVWSYMHCMQSALGDAVPADWNYLGITPHHVLRNVLDVVPPGEEVPRGGIRHFGFSGAWRHPGGTILSDPIHHHLGQYIHFYGKMYPDEAGIAEHLRTLIAPANRNYEFNFPLFVFFLDLDEKPPAVIPEGLPFGRHFEYRGKILMSSGFGPDDTYILYSAGGGEMPGHHDATHFSIYRRGFLALDTGTRAQTYFNNTSDQGHFYFQQTIAHNCILIRDPEETVMQVFPLRYKVTEHQEPRPIAHTGGQSGPRNEAELLAFESREYVYAATDATPTYSTNRCSQMVRQFVFLPPEHVVVFDRVTAVRPEFPKTWLFHTANEPLIYGNVFRADQGDGRIFCRTLYPVDARLESIGGPGREFWASGRNWPVPDDSPYLDRVTDENGGVPEVQGRWRVEVTPGAARELDHFLHLIQTGDKSIENMVAAELNETDETLEVVFAHGQREYILNFNKTGPVGGHIRINVDGDLSVDRAFTDEIMPQSGLAIRDSVSVSRDTQRPN